MYSAENDVFLIPDVNYTIMMGNAPGPTGNDLTISLDFDPFFLYIYPEDQTQIIGLVKTIKIYVGGHGHLKTLILIFKSTMFPLRATT